MPTDQQIKDWMMSTKEYYMECGEVNCTKMAEDCCNEFDAYIGDDCEIPEVFFEVAALIQLETQT